MNCQTHTLTRIFILCALILSFKTGLAQNKEFTTGIFAGFYGIHIEGDIDYMYSLTDGNIWGTGGLSFGFNVRHYFSDHIYGAFDLRYIQKGSIFEFLNPYGLPAYVTIKLHYIEIPILAGFKINLKKKYLLAETGLAYGRMFSSKMSVSEYYSWDPSSKMAEFKKNDFSWVANIKYPVIRSKKLLVGFRFSYSLASIHKVYNLHNMDYGVEVYYLFNNNIK